MVSVEKRIDRNKSGVNSRKGRMRLIESDGHPNQYDIVGGWRKMRIKVEQSGTD